LWQRDWTGDPLRNGFAERTGGCLFVRDGSDKDEDVASPGDTRTAIFFFAEVIGQSDLACHGAPWDLNLKTAWSCISPLVGGDIEVKAVRALGLMKLIGPRF